MLVRNLFSPQIEIPNEPGQWMQFRRLNSRRIALCVERRQTEALNKMKELGADGLALIRDAAATRDKSQDDLNKPKPVADPLDAYDRDLLLTLGISAWSYPADVTTELSDENGGLDAATSEWAARQVLKFNGLLPDERETELGN
jgi:hypothetical protein